MTDGHTDGQTDKIAISISCVSVPTRDKNSDFSTNILLYLFDFKVTPLLQLAPLKRRLYFPSLRDGK